MSIVRLFERLLAPARENDARPVALPAGPAGRVPRRASLFPLRSAGLRPAGLHRAGPLAALAGALLLAGCASGSAPNSVYELSAPRQFPPARAATSALVVIAEPQALAILDSERIVVRGTGGDLAYLPGAQWSDRLPKLLQSRMVQAFENAGRFRAVGRPGERLSADIQIVTDIRSFALTTGGGTAGEVELSVKLVDDRSGRIRAARVFGARVEAGGTEGAQAAAALDAALDRVLIEIIGWASGRL